MFQGQYNLNGKGNIEKLFFGDFNAMVEFYYCSPYQGEYGFRIIKKNLLYVLEVKHISNFDEIREKKSEERLKLCKIEVHTYPINTQFAEDLYKNMVSCISNFEAKIVSDPNLVPIIRGGYSVTFRTVIDKAVLWSLWVQNPNENALRMTDLCKQIAADAKADKLDETAYITVLNTFEN